MHIKLPTAVALVASLLQAGCVVAPQKNSNGEFPVCHTAAVDWPTNLTLEQLKDEPIKQLDGGITMAKEGTANVTNVVTWREFERLSKAGYRLSGVLPVKEPAPEVTEEPDAVVWTGFKSTAILEGVQKVITEAKHTLHLASYSFTGMRENRFLLLAALADARKRGVQVEMLLRDRSRDLVEIAALLDIGVEVRANRVNHAKYAIADGEYGLLFSANFDGLHGLTDGVETGVRLRREEAREVAEWHSQMWRETPSQALLWPTSDSIAQALPAIRTGRPAFLGEKISIIGDEETLSRCKTILVGPCVFLVDGDPGAPRRVRLVGFDDVVHLERNGDEMKAVGIDRDDALFCPLPKFIANRRQSRAHADARPGPGIIFTKGAGSADVHHAQSSAITGTETLVEIIRWKIAWCSRHGILFQPGEIYL